jgi:single-strand DNA-binding protein
MATLNQCNFIGRIGKQPELQFTSGGKPYLRFSLAVDQGKNETMWLNVVCWDKLAETMEERLSQGAQVYLSGRLQIKKFVDKNKVERMAVDITALDIQLLEKKQTAEPAE